MARSWEAAERVKKAVKLPVVAAGGVRSPEKARSLLFSGRVDLLAVDKALIADPDFAGRILGTVQGRYRPCLGCLEGCLNTLLEGRSLECVSNPQVGLDHREGSLPKTKTPKKVAVVGGGPMAMEAAITLHQRGHEVTLFSAKDAYVMTYDGKEGPLPARDLLQFLKAETRRKVRVVAAEEPLRGLPGKFEAVVLAAGDEFESQVVKISAESKPKPEVLSGLARSLHKAVIVGYEAALKI
jgi:NADPH-dependent 2,4-dienoyl-CoA reductase/sulfur reductase-like enzyme